MNEETEYQFVKCCVSALVLDQQTVFADLESWFRSDWIEDLLLRRLYQACVICHRKKIPPASRDMLDAIGRQAGRKFASDWHKTVADMLMHSSYPWHHAYAFYASEIYERQRRVAVAHHLAQAQASVMDESNSVDGELDRLEKLKSQYKPPPRRGRKSLRSVILDELDPESEPYCYRFKIEALDRSFQVHDGQLTTIAARPSMGKSTLLQWLAMHHCLDGNRCCYITLEMTAREMVSRLLKSISAHKNVGVAEAANLLERFDIEFHEESGLNSILRAVSANAVHTDSRLLVCVDYLQLVEADSKELSRLRRHELIATITRKLKTLASRFDQITVVAASQLNREADGNERPRLKHLRESGAIEQDSNNVLLIHVEEKFRPSAIAPVELICAKNRNGSVSVCHATWDKAQYCYLDQPEEKEFV